MKIIKDFVTNSSEADFYYDNCGDCDCRDCDCRDCDDCDCDCDDCDCDCDEDCRRTYDYDYVCSIESYVNDMFHGNWGLYEEWIDDLDD